jgi:putative redox protein
MVSATIGAETYKTELVATGHVLLADEPEEAGGSDEGPSPGQFLQLSLASCTAITLRMYANRKQINLRQVRVEVDATRDTNKTIFQRHIYLEGDLSDEQRARLLEIANACPVHRTLTHPIEIETVLRAG